LYCRLRGQVRSNLKFGAAKHSSRKIRARKSPPVETEAGSCESLARCNLYQRLADLFLVPETHRQVIAVAAPAARPFVEMPGTNGVRHDTRLCQVLGKVGRLPRAEIPVDPRLLRADEDAERDLLGLRLGELVGGELVGELHVVVLVGGDGRLEVDHGAHVVELCNEVDDADQCKVE